jgi:hypothetical protein
MKLDSYMSLGSTLFLFCNFEVRLSEITGADSLSVLAVCCKASFALRPTKFFWLFLITNLGGLAKDILLLTEVKSVDCYPLFFSIAKSLNDFELG